MHLSCINIILLGLCQKLLLFHFILGLVPENAAFSLFGQFVTIHITYCTTSYMNIFGGFLCDFILGLCDRKKTVKLTEQLTLPVTTVIL